MTIVKNANWWEANRLGAGLEPGDFRLHVRRPPTNRPRHLATPPRRLAASPPCHGRSSSLWHSLTRLCDTVSGCSVTLSCGKICRVMSSSKPLNGLLSILRHCPALLRDIVAWLVCKSNVISLPRLQVTSWNGLTVSANVLGGILWHRMWYILCTHKWPDGISRKNGVISLSNVTRSRGDSCCYWRMHNGDFLNFREEELEKYLETKTERLSEYKTRAKELETSLESKDDKLLELQKR